MLPDFQKTCIDILVQNSTSSDREGGSRILLKFTCKKVYFYNSLEFPQQFGLIKFRLKMNKTKLVSISLRTKMLMFFNSKTFDYLPIIFLINIEYNSKIGLIMNNKNSIFLNFEFNLNKLNINYYKY